jgi:long-subunit acyl-CoA synthetase (AMP-forming)
VETCVALTKLLEEHGTAGNVLTPAFGMTETCDGALYSKDCPRRDVECKNEFATVGSSVSGMEMRITDSRGKVIGPNFSGHLEVSGPIVFQNTTIIRKPTAEAFNGIWFKTGDLGYIDDWAN